MQFHYNYQIHLLKQETNLPRLSFVLVTTVPIWELILSVTSLREYLRKDNPSSFLAIHRCLVPLCQFIWRTMFQVRYLFVKRLSTRIKRCPLNVVQYSGINRQVRPLHTMANVTFSTIDNRWIWEMRWSSVELVVAHWLMRVIQRCKDLSVGNCGDDIGVIPIRNIGWERFGTPKIAILGSG